MLSDSRQLAEGYNLTADVCIVGAGAAGLALARELAHTPLQVAVIESGGLRPDPVTESLNQGAEGETDYPVRESRARYLGGATNLWSGVCLPLDAIELEARPWMIGSGWPFAKDVLDPYCERASTALDLSPPAIHKLDAFRRTGGDGSCAVEDENVETIIQQFCGVPHLAATWGRAVADSANVTLWLHANATALETAASGERVDKLRVACLDGPTFTVAAKVFVLATGGIENARLLLASNGVREKGIGNEHDLVGRFFADHYNLAPGYVEVVEASMNLDLYTRPRWQGRHWTCGAIALREDARRSLELTGVKVRLYSFIDAELSVSVRALRQTFEALRQRRAKDALRTSLRLLADPAGVARFLAWRGLRRYGVDWSRHCTAYAEIIIEQAPDPENRVTLSAERDALGQLRPLLRTRLSDRDWSRARRGIELVEAALERHGVTALRPWPDDVEPLLLPRHSHHHVGTTRMADRPERGVVDRHCRVHGVSNLYIAGSSVFPTVGSSNPTLTIVALAIRIGDDLRERFQRGSFS